MAIKPRMKKVRRFCVTNWNLNFDYEKLVQGRQVRYLEVGLEICPKTKKKHHQVWIYFVNPKTTGRRSLNKIGKLFGPVHAHVEPCRGSWEENEAYISKDGDYKCYGDKPAQGFRGNLAETGAKVLAGETSVDDICVADPMMFHQYGRTLERLETIALRKKWRTWMTKGIWIFGPAKSGKSHMAYENYDPETHYSWSGDVKWWDGYKGQEIVIFNEFTAGTMKWSRLMDLVDKWPKDVPVRGKESIPFLAKTVIITTIKHPKDVYTWKWDDPGRRAEFHRRFEIIELKKVFSK